MLYELEVLQSNCGQIGNPVPLPLTDIADTNRLGKFSLKVRFEIKII
jgi:hypothetical protein